MNRKSKFTLVIGLVVLSGICAWFFFRPSVSKAPETPQVSTKTMPSTNVEVRDGVQYVTITAKGGYSPRVSKIASGLPTKLVVKTKDTFDCSASLVVRSAGFKKILQSTGEEVIDLSTPKTGDKIQGVCGMGMYSFSIEVL